MESKILSQTSSSRITIRWPDQTCSVRGSRLLEWSPTNFHTMLSTIELAIGIIPSLSNHNLSILWFSMPSISGKDGTGRTTGLHSLIMSTQVRHLIRLISTSSSTVSFPKVGMFSRMISSSFHMTRTHLPNQDQSLCQDTYEEFNNSMKCLWWLSGMECSVRSTTRW